jgi:hypothetical protein
VQQKPFCRHVTNSTLSRARNPSAGQSPTGCFGRQVADTTSSLAYNPSVGQSPTGFLAHQQPFDRLVTDRTLSSTCHPSTRHRHVSGQQKTVCQTVNPSAVVTSCQWYATSCLDRKDGLSVCQPVCCRDIVSMVCCLVSWLNGVSMCRSVCCRDIVSVVSCLVSGQEGQFVSLSTWLLS